MLYFLAEVPRAGAMTTQTITTTYAHNADGALTAVTRQVDAEPAVTTYLTWDDFTPAAGAPTTGTVAAGDGNLLGFGSNPGMMSQFSYDVRDRLLTCNPSGQAAVTYTYHPVSLMASSTLPSGNALNFYYDNAANARMVNTRSVPADQSSTGLTASFLGPVRYLSDGTEQVLLTPRKDTAGLYDAAAQSLSPYSYHPYGSSADSLDSLAAATPPTPDTAESDDVIRNPFRYAGEYQDPTCLTYYLRARWYLPEAQSFLTRDPVDGLHRYSYTAGDPIGSTDPSGLKYTGEDFSRGVDRAVHRLTPHILAYIEPVLPVWGQVLGGIELFGLLPSFFHHPTTEGDITFGFLAASIASEGPALFKPFDRLSPFFLNPNRAFLAREGIDLTLGGSQTLAQSDRDGRIDTPALIQGIDTTLAGIFWARMSGGLGYRPYSLSTEEVDQLTSTHFESAGRDGSALVYRVRYKQFAATTTSPYLESAKLGLYHEALLVVERDDLTLAHLTNPEGMQYSSEVFWRPRNITVSKFLSPETGNVAPQLSFVGTFNGSDVIDLVEAEHVNGRVNENIELSRDTSRSRRPDYNAGITNNCHHYVQRIVGRIYASGQ